MSENLNAQGVNMNDQKSKLRNQIFWDGANDNNSNLKNWYAYVNRAPQVYGHIIIAYDQEIGGDEDKWIVPKGFEKALTKNYGFLSKWGKEYKGKTCIPVFFKMNIEGKWFRVHILPVSEQEQLDASESLWKRVEGTLPGRGGFIHYLGPREEKSDVLNQKYKKATYKKEKK